MTLVHYSELNSVTHNEVTARLRKLDSLEHSNYYKTAFRNLHPSDYFINTYHNSNGTHITLPLDIALEVYNYYDGTLETKSQTQENIIDQLNMDFWWRPDRYSPDCNLCHNKSKRTSDLLTSEVNETRDEYTNGWYPPIIASNSSGSQYHEDCVLQRITEPVFKLLEDSQEYLIAIQI